MNRHMTQSLAADSLKHSHQFDEGNPLAEKNTLRVAILTAVMMVVEIAGGWYYNSMALLADGWHMSSHMLTIRVFLLAPGKSRFWAAIPAPSFW
jgi:Co/Zn/Cd efflux system component